MQNSNQFKQMERGKEELWGCLAAPSDKRSSALRITVQGLDTSGSVPNELGGRTRPKCLNDKVRDALSGRRNCVHLLPIGPSSHLGPTKAE
jgi:hypothetical protein